METAFAPETTKSTKVPTKTVKTKAKSRKVTSPKAGDAVPAKAFNARVTLRLITLLCADDTKSASARISTIKSFCRGWE